MAAISDSASAITVDDVFQTVSGLNAGNFLVVNPATNATSFSSVADNLKVVGMDMNGGAGTATTGVGITPN